MKLARRPNCVPQFEYFALRQEANTLYQRLDGVRFFVFGFLQQVIADIRG